VCTLCVYAFVWQVFKSNKTAKASSMYLNDAILQGIEGLQELLIYDRSLQPASKSTFFKNVSKSPPIASYLLSFSQQCMQYATVSETTSI